MGVITGLAAIRETMESKSLSFDNVSDRELTRSIPKNGEKTIRFVQEVDPSSPLYKEEYGLGVVAVEYQHPSIFWLRLTDSSDEDGACWPQEQGWDQKVTLYINVVDVETGEVFYVARSIQGGLGQQIIESASDRGSLSDGVWKIKKTGEGMKTRYSLNMISIASDPVDVDPSLLVNFEKSVLNQVPYKDQESYVRTVENRVNAKRNGDPSDPGASDEQLAW
jgi:hypothetical protein